MTETQVLTDTEIDGIWKVEYKSAEYSHVAAIFFARAVERAVLKRVAEIDADCPVLMHRGHEYVSVEECRERERRAFYHGVRSELTWRLASVTGGADMEKIKADCEALYPSLLPAKRVSRTVTLADGRVVRRLDEMAWEIVAPNGLVIKSEFPSRKDAPFYLADTPADARLLADLVERPYEEPCPKTPPPLVLSTGTWVREDGIWRGGGDNFTRRLTTEQMTAADADALARWLRKHGEAK